VTVRIEPLGSDHVAAWKAMRSSLWPDADDHDTAATAAREPSDDAIDCVAIESGVAIGFATATLRSDDVNGCDGSPVLFLEGVYVLPEARGCGVGRALVEAIAHWGEARGIAEFASDALLDAAASHAFHARLGFTETERVVYFRRLTGASR
jgi:aminoglycoside 6'-N-acetyltransferase I